jgi:hypothetical protein
MAKKFLKKSFGQIYARLTIGQKLEIEIAIVILILIIGMVFYHFVEGWRYLDSLYFCSTTLAAVGY